MIHNTITSADDTVRLRYSRRGYGSAVLRVDIDNGDGQTVRDLDYRERTALLALTNPQLQVFVDWLAAGLDHEVLARQFVERSRAALTERLTAARAEVARLEASLNYLKENA
jgi:septation ring formation regulator EzrA